MHYATQDFKKIITSLAADLSSCRSLPAAPNQTNADRVTFPKPSCRGAEPRVMCDPQTRRLTGGAMASPVLSYLQHTWKRPTIPNRAEVIKAVSRNPLRPPTGVSGAEGLLPMQPGRVLIVA